ncbi:hypothetical protein KQI68_06690 [Peptoniphilus sp. MSJ-1]|uniref:Uncharacterized protein n=1 Tax=Peptoniphilus ovalis TaxID=2841503 RepID=A0ABS6FJZ1_9FIRM|nr:hypothetical protein [Peptoniphilus ovalis]MBU5669525.1 hypothetical protein [Peptoniphilus ovalis]
MENIQEFIKRCLTELKNPENERDAILILEGLDIDVITNGVPPEIDVAYQLHNIGEDDIVEIYINPLIAELDNGREKE